MAKGAAPTKKTPPKRERRLSDRQLVLLLVAVIGAVVAGSLIWLTADAEPTGDTATLSAVKSYDHEPPKHVAGRVAYSQIPSTGGDHNPVWLNCGMYRTAVTEEQAVHSMEHGAAWITYRPSLPSDEVAELAVLATENYTLVSPYEGLEAPIIVTSWGKQLKVQSVDDPALSQFLDAYRQGPDTPEPGAPCTGGTGSPQ